MAVFLAVLVVLGAGRAAAAPVPLTAWVADQIDGTLTPVDVATGTAGTPLTVGPGFAIAITPDGKTAFVANFDGGTVTPVDLTTRTIGTPILVGDSPAAIAITPDGATAYVVNQGSSDLTPIDVATLTAGTAIPVGSAPNGVAITPDGSTAYVADFANGDVIPVDLATGTVGAPISVCLSAAAVAIAPDGLTAYAACFILGTLTPLDLATGTPGIPIPVGNQPFAIAITPDGATAYVANSIDGTVSPVDLATGIAGTPIPVGDGAFSVAVAPNGEVAYATGGVGVTPIDVATNTAQTPIPTGSFAHAVAFTPEDRAPTATDDPCTTTEDTPCTLPAPGVLGNDSDADGDALTATLDTQPTSGTVALNPDGSFTYTPAPGFSGTDSFTYHASDGLLESSPATVTVTVTPVNDAPTAAADACTTAEDTPCTVPAPGVLGNDSDPDGDQLSAILETATTSGTVVLNPNGSYTYTPDPGFSGTDSFTYHASDGLLDSSVATVNITVTPVNDAPTAADDTCTTDEDTPCVTAAPGVLANDSDAEGDPLTAALDTAPAHGTVTLNADGSFSYTPAANFSGADSFTYHASDGPLVSNTATVAITVTPVDDAPTATGDSCSTTEDTDCAVPAPGVLGNDTDQEGDPLTAALETAPTHGTAAVNADGSFTYTPAAGFSGSDSFTYRASDGQLVSSPATVTVTGTPVNDAPAATADACTTDEDTPCTVSAPGVLGNDSDPDGDTLTATLDTATTNGTVALSADGSYTYTPAPGFSGSDSFTYHAGDGLLDSGVATVTITVTPVNDAPAATGDSCTTDADTDCTASAPGVLANDSDPDGDALTATLDTAAASGTVALNADGSYTYTPDPGFSGTDAFTYRATDGLLDSSPATVTITVTPPPATTTAPTTTTTPTTPTTTPTPTTTTTATTTTPPPPQQFERDTLAPTAPAPLNGRLVRGQRGFARTSLALSWSPSTDNVGVDRYELAGNDALVQVLPSSAASATVALRGNATYALGAPPATAASGRRSRWRSAPALLSVRPFPRGPGDFWPGVPVQAPRAGRGPPHRVTSRTGTGPGRGGVSTRTGSSADGRATVDDRTETESTLVPAPGFEPRPTRV